MIFMKSRFRNLYPLFLAALAVTAACSKQETVQDEPETGGAIVINEGIGEVVKGELLIQVRPAASTKAGGDIQDAMAGTDEIAEVLGASGRFRLERLFPECGKFEARTKAEGLDRWYVASFDKSVETSAMVRQLRRCGSVECIEYPMRITMADEDSFAPFSAVPEKLASAKAQVTRAPTCSRSSGTTTTPARSSDGRVSRGRMPMSGLPGPLRPAILM